MYYNISDNSYCINIVNGNKVLLVQEHDEDYSPNKYEDGAKFEIVSKPYSQEVFTGYKDYVTEMFINVKSSLTGNIYRVLYYENNIY